MQQRSVPAGASGNEEELGFSTAYLFAAGDWLGVTRDESGASLPPRDDVWQPVRPVALGIRVSGIPGVTPEVVIKGLFSDGYYVWRPDDPSRIPSTSQ